MLGRRGAGRVAAVERVARDTSSMPPDRDNR